jgi:hypothetical protein
MRNKFMAQPVITRHGRERLQQRGTTPRQLKIVLEHGDIDVPSGSRCRYLRLSHGAVASLQKKGVFTVQEVDHAKRLVVLLNSSDDVITVLKCSPERRLRRPRR